MRRVRDSVMSPSISPSPSLTERMAALKAKHDTNHRSECTNPTHINTLLELYNKAPHECYINYMEGFKLLLDWLCPLESSFVLTKYPEVKVLRTAGGYDQSEIASIIAKKFVGYKDPDKYLDTVKEIQVAIQVYNAKSVPRDYLS